MNSDAISYRFRPNAFVGERTYTLTDDALVVEEAGKPRDGAFFDAISEVRLVYAPTRVATNRYRAQILFREGGMAELFNTHYAGFADFPEKNAEYVAFLTELHRRLAAKGKDVAFKRGNSPAGYAANWLLVIFIFVGLAFVFVVLVTAGLSEIAMGKLGIIVFFLPVLIRYMQRATPGRYDSLDIPNDLLPTPEQADSATSQA